MYDREFSTTGREREPNPKRRVQNRTVVSYSRLSHMHGGFLTGVQNKKQFRASWRRVRFLIRQKPRIRPNGAQRTCKTQQNGARETSRTPNMKPNARPKRAKWSMLHPQASYNVTHMTSKASQPNQLAKQTKPQQYRTI